MNICEAREQFDLILASNSSLDVPVKDLENIENEFVVPQQVFSPKRRKKDTSRGNLHGTLESSSIMRLYDRSINLSHVDATFSLYSVGREWMRNEPTRPPPPPQPAVDEEEDDSLVVCCYDDTDATPYPEQPTVPVCKGGSLVPRIPVDIDILRQANIKRWKSIRGQWERAFEENYNSHPECVNFIKSLYQPPMD
eukprot:sb/3470915/